MYIRVDDALLALLRLNEYQYFWRGSVIRKPTPKVG